MRENLKVYDLYLEVQGPVFIGNGREINKKEYLFFSGNQVGVIDIEKLYSFLKKKGLSRQYEAYLMETRTDGLKKWLDNNRISVSEIRPYMKYIIDNERVEMQGGGRSRPLQLFEFVKDPYGRPYVPGSSVKGMLRTILLGEDMILNERRYASKILDIKQEVRTLSARRKTLKCIKEVENIRFCTLNRDKKKVNNAVNDFMSGIIISDSDPLETSDLNVCPKIDRHTDGKTRALPLLRECLKPGTKIRCTLTVDSSIMSRAGNNLTEENILEAAKLFVSRYNSEFAEKFGRKFALDKESVLLGGGSGFVSKTVIYSMLSGKEGLETVKTILDKTAFKHNSYKDQIASPRVLKCTFYKGKEYQMGVCRLKITKR